tara:strand:+ start:4540 stop:4938 length:399 start_codon:yes stop_codon:yes gene_type:complete
MSSFQRLYEKLASSDLEGQRDGEQEAEDTSLMGANTDTSTVTDTDPKALDAIRAGINLKEDESFWDDFIRIANNSEGLAALLDVRPDQVGQWGQKVQEALSKVKELDHREPDDAGKTEIMPTGGEGQGQEQK